MELTIKSLSKKYPNGVQSLNNVSLNISNGMFGLLGPNGAGKSTLMRTLATLQEADQGSITLDGTDIFKSKNTYRQRLGYLPQDFGVYPRVSAEQMLDHIARLKGILNHTDRKKLVQSLLENVNLLKDRKKNLGTYSGGMKQRFGIAQALIGDPNVIIVDEPTAGLDPIERKRFYNLLGQIGQNAIVILSTHIVEDVSVLCTRFAILSQGEVIYKGDPDDALKALNNHIFTKAVDKNDIGIISAKHELISTQIKSGKLYARIYSPSKPNNDFLPAEPTLEDVYFRLLEPAVKDTIE